ncbi:hypothetical protein LTR62_004073 [Meristemomyces frigidus]|uniref:Uncharacterized protein n=1 Tax=Meristemomyces frigidus TaxID=1508187 RepID=A0AAN7YN61_9PEZI|nr:hypothetical protein LTR62_004073 [Meristemomyces frigidus]
MHHPVARLVITGLLSSSLALAARASCVPAWNFTTLYPISVCSINGSVSNASPLRGNGIGNALIINPASVTYDFGKNITGNITIEIGDVDPDQYIGLTYTTNRLLAGSSEAVNATGITAIDGPFWHFATGPGNWTVPNQRRHYFRYVSLLHNTTGGIEVRVLSVEDVYVPSSILVLAEFRTGRLVDLKRSGHETNPVATGQEPAMVTIEAESKGVGATYNL